MEMDYLLELSVHDLQIHAQEILFNVQIAEGFLELVVLGGQLLGLPQQHAILLLRGAVEQRAHGVVFCQLHPQLANHCSGLCRTHGIMLKIKSCDKKHIDVSMPYALNRVEIAQSEENQDAYL